METGALSRKYRMLWILSILFCSLQLLAPHALAENGVTKDEIILGQSTALTGPLAELGVDSSTAAKAYFDYINSQGGVHGRQIRLITLDDAYNTEKGVKNVKHLIENEKVFSLFNLISTATNIELLPVITEAGIPSIAPYSGAEALRKPFNRLMFHVRASYADEIRKIISHFSSLGTREVSIVYQNNAFGKGNLAVAESVLAEHKVKLIAAQPIETDASNAASAAAAIKKSQPQAILLFTAGKPSIEFIKAYNKLEQGKQFYALSVMGTQVLLDSLGKDGSGVVVSQVVPFPFSATTDIVKEYQRVMKKMGVTTQSFSSMEGFLIAKVTVEALKKAGKRLDRENFIAALEGMRSVDMDGFVINFNKKSHEGSRYVELTIINERGKFVR